MRSGVLSSECWVESRSVINDLRLCTMELRRWSGATSRCNSTTWTQLCYTSQTTAYRQVSLSVCLSLLLFKLLVVFSFKLSHWQGRHRALPNPWSERRVTKLKSSKW